MKKLSSGIRNREQLSADGPNQVSMPDSNSKLPRKPSKNGLYQRLRDWYNRKVLEYKESWAEVKQNPDYAEYVACRFDFCTAMITFVAFNVVVILLLAIQSQEQPTIYYG